MNADGATPGDVVTSSGPTRRHVLHWIVGSLGTVAVGAVVGLELVNHGVLPGKQLLDQLDGACSLLVPRLRFAPTGPTVSGRFFSASRRRSVGYSISYPPGRVPGDRLPLIVMLHGYGDDHTTALKGMTPAQAVALLWKGHSLTPMAMVTVDGGNGYWNPHPGDDPLAMVVNELIPLCQSRGLGRAPHGIGLMGISMGGYGALMIGERRPGLASAVAAISPAVWTSYAQARAANPRAFSSASAFARGDVITHVGSLRGTPVRVASGVDDPFLAGVQTFMNVLPPSSVYVIGAGCHSDPFFVEQEPPSLAFLSAHLA